MTTKTPREALENLRTHQQQLDQDGIMVGVSRQALDEVIAYCASLEGNQRTPGTVESCKLCGGDVARLSSFFKEKCRGNIKSDNYTTNCPLKVTK